MIDLKIVFPVLVLLFFIGCSSTSQKNKNSYNELEPCFFANPVADGQDPWITKKDDSYYYIESRAGGLFVSEFSNPTDLKSNEEHVWSPPETGWNRANVWAPELHYYDGKWYIHYAAGDTDGAPFTKQRSGVLESETDDPQGEYIDRGMLYTGDNIEDESKNIWSIDLTMLEVNDQLYGVWSGWEENRDDDATPQHLYIAEMENPWTISSNRVKISSPEEEWEISSSLPINEGPQILKHEGDVFIIYSASQSWLPSYKLGQLKLTGDDPMDPANWQKKGPVFDGTEDVIGVGHASFTTSPDGSEHWIVYHTKVSPDPGWNRVVHTQPFDWKPNGEPNFGTPVPAGKELDKPSGSCSK